MAMVLIDDLAAGVRLLTLNRPKVNVFNLELMQSLSSAVKDAEQEASVRALVVRGAGAVFSAGLDFKALLQSHVEGTQRAEHFGSAMDQAFFDVWTCRKPTVAVVTGHAIAAGYFVALACDFRYVVAGGGRYGMNELVFGAGFTRTAIEIGRHALQQHMAHAIQNAELFGWQEGLRNGSFHAGFENEEQLLAAAVAQAAKVGAMPPEAYAHVKAQLLDPYVDEVLAETGEEKRKTLEIYRSRETLQAIKRYVASLGGQQAAVPD